MKTADATALEWQKITGHRSDSGGGFIQFKRLLRGDEGSRDNFELTLAEVHGMPPVPAHTHNFDQIRFVLSGSYSFRPDKTIAAGSLAYFPEGASYGPESAEGDPVMISLQFGGASGQGFMSMDQLQSAIERLKERGEFTDGKFRTADGVERDGYEAAYEEAMGRAPVYPEPRYPDPILIEAANFEWYAENGIERKTLGVFTERRTEIALIRVPAGGSTDLSSPDRVLLLFVVDGAATINGYEAREQHAIAIERGEAAELRADEGAELLAVYLPAFG